jgi:hypothetical protein
MTQAELIEAKERHSSMVSGKECASIREELDRLRTQLAEAQEEGQGLRARVEEVKESRRRRSQKIAVNHLEADIKRQSQGHLRAARMSVAKNLSAKAVQDQKGTDSKLQADKLSQLSEQKSQLETDLQAICKQNFSLEQRMEVLRNRNRQLEIQLKKQHTADDDKEAMLREDLKKLVQRLKILSDVMQNPADLPTDLSTDVLGLAGREDDFMGSETTTSPPSAYASTSSMAGAWSSKRSLAPTHSTDGLNEQGNQTVEATANDSLSQVASKVIAARTNESMSPRASHSVGDGVNATLGSPEEIERDFASIVESRDSALKSPELKSPSHLDASIARTQMLLSEVQGWCVSAK